MQSSLLARTLERILPDVVALRHEFHHHPELRFEERWTSDRIARFLDDVGVPYRRGYARGTGIVATLKGKPGKTIALRADMDCLELTEETGLPYASCIPNRMHGCGHDGHMAVLCGAAAVLKAHQAELPGSVRFIFQPAEELVGGARLMVDEGAVDGVDGVFGLHGWPESPVGAIVVKPGAFMASADFFRITIRGKGSHGADPAAGVDSIVVGAHIITALQTVLSRELNPWDAGVVSVGSLHAGAASNIIPETAILEGTIRSIDAGTDQAIRTAMGRIIAHTAQAFRATASIQFGEAAYPALHNDPSATRHLCGVAKEALGEEGVIVSDHAYMVAEDFAYYLERAPGAFFFLGVNPHPGQAYPPLHSPHFDFTDAALPAGIHVMAQLAMQPLEA